jgi:putative restriction endonuclease
MPNVSFSTIQLHQNYSRNELAPLWGYRGYEAISRGVVTPADSPFVILFVTHEKQASAEQYDDRLDDDRLYWDGPTDHYAEDRMINAETTGNEIHLFYRKRHHTDFTYYGRLVVEQVTRFSGSPSKFVFRLVDS